MLVAIGEYVVVHGTRMSLQSVLCVVGIIILIHHDTEFEVHFPKLICLSRICEHTYTVVNQILQLIYFNMRNK